MNGYLSVSHTGDVPGMLSKTMMIPDLNLGVVVLTNTAYGGAGVFRAVSQTIVDSYMGLEERDWTGLYLEQMRTRENTAAEVVSAVWETVGKGDHSHIKNSDYTGTYADPWFGTIDIHTEGDRLWFTSRRSPGLNGPMYHYKAQAFAVRWEEREMFADAFAIFTLDEEGRARHITMKGISPDIDFSYDFQDLSFDRIE
jgi:hypothetical protein